ncbi:hypothetical protein FRC08_007781 [Ceratobasidium sp. 394]|nr:hypothetical protein FRC08_007781 [Ceratobasidium sp. 394]
MKFNLKKAVFAFLSACESAAGDRGQPDESIHLGAGLLFAGFRSIVGTLWSMDDADGPEVARVIYGEIFKDGGCNYEAIPHALDLAVRQLRSKGVHPSRWATYVHIGI